MENAAEIWKWLEAEGAHFFVCGDARRMAKDVDAALRKIIQEQGGRASSKQMSTSKSSRPTNATSATSIELASERLWPGELAGGSDCLERQQPPAILSCRDFLPLEFPPSASI